MTNRIATPAKILICFVGRHRGERLVTATKRAGARGGTISLGVSLGNSRLLQALSLADVQQDVVFTLMGKEADAVVAEIRRAADADPKRLGGTALVLGVPEFFQRVVQPDDLRQQPVQDEEKKTRSQPMESGYTLITVIVNSGFGDDMMAAARKAGASGGTVLNARGTGTEEDVKFFGITLVPEKEMLLIVAEKDKIRGIIDALGSVPKFSEPGAGIVFTQNVEEFILLGRQKPWQGSETRQIREKSNT